MMLDIASKETFSAALDAIRAAGFELAAEGKPITEINVYSGGAHDLEQTNIPALFTMPQAAMESWRDTVLTWFAGSNVKTFRFTMVPKLEKFIMTEMGEAGAQRLSAIRWGVSSRVAVLETGGDR